MSITLREATVDDCDDLYRWRNDPVTREQFFENEVVPYEEHQRWFNKAMENSNRLFFIGFDERDEKCGVVRFDIKDALFAEISLNVAPEKRGRGVGSQLILKSCPLFFSKTKRRLILARTKEQNIASIKAFNKAGFSKLFHYIDSKWGGVLVLVLLAPFESLDEEMDFWDTHDATELEAKEVTVEEILSGLQRRSSKTRVTLRLEMELLNKIKALAAKQSVSYSSLIRELLWQGVKAHLH